MSNNYSSGLESSKQSPVLKKIQIFAALKRVGFSGQILWQDCHSHQWIFYLSRGKVVYGTGGVHPIRQWYRQFKLHCPDVNINPEELYRAVTQVRQPILPANPEYQLLYDWLEQKKLKIRAFRQIICHIVSELLFEILQADQVQYQLHRKAPLGLDADLIGIDHDEALKPAQLLWQEWAALGLEEYSPNHAPIIRRPGILSQEVSSQTYQVLTQLLDGQQSLRDLAVKTRRDLTQFLQVLQPYIQRETIELVEVSDYPKFTERLSVNSSAQSGREIPLIACIDDSLMVCQSMSQVIKAAGYDFLSISEGAKAVKTLLLKKPDAIFLDLVMPDTNGYEICEQLRKISAFKEVPIIILSGNDGLVDQVRARLLGATDFLSKPAEPIVILSIIRKYLKKRKTSDLKTAY